MAGSTMNLSLLARGIGTVVQNGHEKIDVKLEPEDYYNFMENQHRVYLPPLEPKYAFVDEGNTPKGSLPKTFITRKGALLLFSEDYATRREHGDGAATERSHRNKTDHNYSLDDLNLKTVDDLGKSILAYGSQVQDGVNLRFIKPPINTPRRVRPGFSARRYLSRLTRSFDDTFLDKLLKNGYVHEKTLFVNNALVPSLKRRINDDLSYMPAPYRIMKQMLMAPGILSGYTFYKGDTNMHDLDPLDEEDEAEVMSEPIEQKGGDAGLTPMAIGIMDSNERIVSYSDLGDDEKEHVLADLLVKSAITHALDVQREKVLSSGAGSEAGSSHHSSYHSGSVVGGSGGRGSGAGAAGDLGLNMEDAIRSFLESQATRSQQSSAKPHIDDKDLPLVSATPRSHNSLRVHGTPHPPSSQKEYVGGAAVVSLRDNSMASVHSKPGQAESRSSSQSPTRTVSQAASQQPHPPATPPTSHAHPPSEATSRVASQPPSQAASHAPDQTGGVYSAAASQAGSKAGSHAGSRRSSARESLHQQQEEEGFPAEGIPSPADIASARDATFNPTPVLPPIAHGTASSTPRSLGLGISASDNEADDTPRSDKAPSEKAGGSRRSSQRGAQSHRSSIAGGNASRDQSPRSVISQSQFTLDLDALPKGDFAAVLGGGPSHPASVAGSGAGDTASVTSHSSMRGKALRATGSTPRSKQSNRSDGEEDGPKAGGGSVIYAPDGSLISVGGSVAPKEPVPPAAPVEDDMTAAEATQLPAEDGAEAEEAGADDDVLAEQQPVSARSSARSHRSGGSARSSAGKLGFNRMRGGDTRLPTLEQEKTIDVIAAQNDEYVPDSETGSIQEEGATFTRPVTEQELISALTDHAHKIAESILSQPDTGLDLVEDAKRAGDMWLAQNPANDISRRHSVDEDYQRAVESMASLRDAAKSADPTVAEYKDLLRETLASVMSSVHGSQQSIPAEADVDPALIDALAHEDIAPEDIEVTTDEEGKALIRARRSAAIQRELRGVKSGHTYRPAGGEGGDEVAPSIGLPRDADLGSLDVINYRADGGDSGDAGGAGKDESEHDSQKSSRRVSIKSGGSEKSRTSVKSKDDAASSKAGSSVKLEAASSAQSPTKSARSKKSIDDREEFVVGKVPDPKEIPALFGPIEEPPKPKEKKPRVPPAKPAKKAKGKKGTGKKAGKKEAAEAPTPQSERASESVAAATAEPPAPNSKEGSVSHRSQLSGSPAPSEAKSEESMEFIIVRDEFSDEEPEVKSSRSVKSVKSVKSGTSSLGTMDTDDSHCKRHSQKSESEAEPEDGAVDLKAARAAKRAAQAEKRRLEVERKRREREEAVKKEKEEQERKEQLMRELEEDRRRKEEERRLAKEAKEQEKLRQEQLEQEKERKRQQELEREKRMKEEYQRKLEEMKRKQAEEDRIRKELEEQRQREAEEARLAEEAMLSQMAEAERIEYERRKREAEEEARRAEEALRKQREEEAAKAMEEAKRLAEEMARREEALRLRLQFNRAMQLESNGLAHSQEITRAFVFSYYELLKWLGIDVPEFERWKETMKF